MLPAKEEIKAAFACYQGPYAAENRSSFFQDSEEKFVDMSTLELLHDHCVGE